MNRIRGVQFFELFKYETLNFIKIQLIVKFLKKIPTGKYQIVLAET